MKEKEKKKKKRKIRMKTPGYLGGKEKQNQYSRQKAPE